MISFRGFREFNHYTKQSVVLESPVYCCLGEKPAIVLRHSYPSFINQNQATFVKPLSDRCNLLCYSDEDPVLGLYMYCFSLPLSHHQQNPVFSWSRVTFCCEWVLDRWLATHRGTSHHQCIPQPLELGLTRLQPECIIDSIDLGSNRLCALFRTPPTQHREEDYIVKISRISSS